LVTTATITHATPAGFAAIERSRDNEAGIALQYRGVVDVALGGGHRFFDAAQRKDGKDVYAWYRESGYATFRTRAELLSGAAGKAQILGVFDPSHLPYTVDQLNDPKVKEAVPTLAEMSRVALDSLDQGREGFLLQIEGARVDHAAHVNDAAGLLWDFLAFDDAVRVALEFQAKRPETLIVLCSDHGNSSPTLRGMGVEYNDSAASFELMLKARGSYTPLVRMLKDGAREAVANLLGVELTAEEAEPLQAAIARTRPTSINQQLNNVTGTLGQVLANHTGIAWVGESHTADYVVTTAVGPGAQEFSGLIRNTDVFGKLTRMMGVTHKNPAMDPEAAKKFRTQASARVHWA
jgi:alkaline phosphatase